ncbi:MAG: glycosyl hydrolase 53 family protein [Lachnospiraceae bacterium]|nr:glycosyl hydrolase 53 family protein [Lachnospiraceae bacterium]
MEFIKGMDISTLIDEETCVAKYFDHGVQGDALEILKQYGANYVRLRLWNDPYAEDGRPYGAGTNDLEKTMVLAERAKALGMGVLLDLHYSDFWADPGKQNVPKAWRGLGSEELQRAVYDFTVDTMTKMKEADVAPTIVQVGNEITNGLLWPTGKKPNFDAIADYVSAGIRGVKAVDRELPVMLHLDNGGLNAMYVEWFDNYVRRGEDFEIIGLSYYPFWHGTLEELSYNMKDMAARYGKQIAVAEVSMGFSMADYRKYEVPAEIRGEHVNAWINQNLKGKATRPELVERLTYPMTPEGQADFMQDVMERIAEVEGGLGFFYWEPAWIPVPGCGWATEAALEYTGEKGPGGNEWANQALFDYEGNALPALERIRDFG